MVALAVAGVEFAVRMMEACEGKCVAGEEVSLEAARADAASAVFEYDDARAWLADNTPLSGPLAVEVWLFDADLQLVLLVEHRWRHWVPPGGRVEPGETPRQGAARELLEETGLRVELRPRPAAVAVRSYHPAWSVTLGLSYVGVGDPSLPVRPEGGQDVAWRSLDLRWVSAFPDDIDRMRAYLEWHRTSHPELA